MIVQILDRLEMIFVNNLSHMIRVDVYLPAIQRNGTSSPIDAKYRHAIVVSAVSPQAIVRMLLSLLYIYFVLHKDGRYEIELRENENKMRMKLVKMHRGCVVCDARVAHDRCGRANA